MQSEKKKWSGCATHANVAAKAASLEFQRFGGPLISISYDLTTTATVAKTMYHTAGAKVL